MYAIEKVITLSTIEMNFFLKRLKKLDVNQVFINSMLHMKSHEMSRKDKLSTSALHR